MKRRTYLQAFLFSLILIPRPSFAAEKILFIGLSGKGAPSIEQTFDRLFRERLRAIPDLVIIDYSETLRYRKLIDFSRYPSVSEQQLASLQSLLPESILLLWGSIRRLQFTPLRRRFITAVVEGKLIVDLGVYRLLDEICVYKGTIESSFHTPKGLVFFTPVRKVTHLSASERAALTDQLVDDAVSKSAEIINTLIHDKEFRSAARKLKNDSGGGRAPSISDVFTVPSVEPPTINTTEAPEVTDSAPPEKREMVPVEENKPSIDTK
ncbi:MAG: hypothetical protein JXA18_11210 [Chitinispirillaceae bacterium]|nr:hypothetical protein [Chitinispirillaceae bacterium]